MLIMGRNVTLEIKNLVKKMVYIRAENERRKTPVKKIDTVEFYVGLVCLLSISVAPKIIIMQLSKISKSATSRPKKR